MVASSIFACYLDNNKINKYCILIASNKDTEFNGYYIEDGIEYVVNLKSFDDCLDMYQNYLSRGWLPLPLTEATKLIHIDTDEHTLVNHIPTGNYGAFEIACGFHPRLGVESPISLLDKYLACNIIRLANQSNKVYILLQWGQKDLGEPWMRIKYMTSIKSEMIHWCENEVNWEPVAPLYREKNQYAREQVIKNLKYGTGCHYVHQDPRPNSQEDTIESILTITTTTITVTQGFKPYVIYRMRRNLIGTEVTRYMTPVFIGCFGTLEALEHKWPTLKNRCEETSTVIDDIDGYYYLVENRMIVLGGDYSPPVTPLATHARTPPLLPVPLL